MKLNEFVLIRMPLIIDFNPLFDAIVGASSSLKTLRILLSFTFYVCCSKEKRKNNKQVKNCNAIALKIQKHLFTFCKERVKKS